MPSLPKKNIALFCLFVAFAAAPFFVQAAGAPALNDTAQETCYIAGTIIKTEQWLYTPYGETPSMFSDYYTRLTVEMNDINLHEKYNAAGQRYCERMAAGTAYTFKLCAPTSPNVGDIVTGVVGPAVGAATDGCLFDLSITGKADIEN